MDPIALVASVVSATTACALLFLLPGLAIGRLVVPTATTPLVRLGVASGVSLLVTLPVCTLLARLGVLDGAVLAGTLAVVSGAGWIARPPRPGRPSRRRSRWFAGAAVGAMLGAALVVVPSRLEAGPDLLPLSSTSWYYANLAQSIADAGGIPATLAEWGGERPFQSDYLPVSSHTAGALLLLPGDLVADLEVYRLVVLVLAVVLAATLFRRWFSSWQAWLGAILLLATVRLDQKFSGYRPETVGLVVALFALWAADRALVERDRRSAALAIASATLVFLCHAEVFLVFAPALVGLAAARALVRSGRPRDRLGFRRPGRGAVRAVGAAFAVLVVAVALGSAIGIVLTGEARIVGYGLDAGRGREATPPPDRPAEVPAGWTFSGDPTWDFYVASVAPAVVGAPAPSRFSDSRLVPRSIAHVWPGLDGRTRGGLAVLVAIVAAPLVSWPLLDARRRRGVLAWVSFGVLLAIGAVALFAISDTYVPMRTGGRRLLPYELFVPVVAVVVLLWGLDRLVRPGWRALLPRRGGMLAAGTALALLTVGAASAAPPREGETDEREPALTGIGYAAYRWIDANLPGDARILANAYTDGAVAAVARRSGIVDGRAVYLEAPGFLAESTALCLGARVVFATPAAPGAATFLERERVSHLLVASRGPEGYDLGGYTLFATNLDAIGADPKFRLVRAFGARLLLYEVIGGGAPSG